MPHFSQYIAYVLLLEPQKMQYLLPSETVSSVFGKVASAPEVESFDGCLGFLTDQTAMAIEAIIAKLISINSNGLSEIKLIDSGRTG